MHTTPQILDALSEKLGGASDYRLAKVLNAASSATITNYRKGKNSMSLDFAHRAAALLGWDPAYVVACVEFERAAKDARLEATDEIKATWSKIAQAFKPAAAILAVFLLGVFAPNQVVRAADVTQFARSSYTLCEVRRRWRAFLCAVRHAFVPSLSARPV